MPDPAAHGAPWQLRGKRRRHGPVSGSMFCTILVMFCTILVLCGTARAIASPPPPVDCAAAARAATAWAGLPGGLLQAIGVVESGRFNRATGTTTPSPYAVDADGAGHRFASAAKAADFVRQSMASGARAVDVGCFQIDLQDHPGAFASLGDAFIPVANADYAAKFLLRLHARLGSWEAAIGAYHSATPALGLPYAKRVNAVWHGEIAGNPAPADDPHVIRLVASHAALPKIITP